MIAVIYDYITTNNVNWKWDCGNLVACSSSVQRHLSVMLRNAFIVSICLTQLSRSLLHVGKGARLSVDLYGMSRARGEVEVLQNVATKLFVCVFLSDSMVSEQYCRDPLVASLAMLWHHTRKKLAYLLLVSVLQFFVFCFVQIAPKCWQDKTEFSDSLHRGTFAGWIWIRFQSMH